MKKLIFLTLLTIEISYSQSLVFPLEVGNRWHYDWYQLQTPFPGFVDYEIIGDVTFGNGKTYAIRKRTASDYPDSYSFDYLRQEGETVFQYSFNDGAECELFRFDLDYGDSTCWRRFIGNHTRTVLGTQVTVYTFGVLNTFGKGEDIADGLGVTTYYFDRAFEQRLTGALINGIQYGSLVNVSDNTTQPHNFQLSQNYPNPFNPSTSIPFSIANSGWVTLSIFNLLGQQVAVLVDGVRSPGNYLVSWQPDALTSGVYFYRLRSEFYTSMKQMVYVK